MQKRNSFAHVGTGASTWKRKLARVGRMITIENRIAKALIAMKWSLVMIGIAFLLGRAMILEQLSPFALAFFAVVYFLRRDLVYIVGAASLAGSLFSVHEQTLWMAVSMLSFMLIQKGIEKYEKTDISLIPLIVFLIVFMTRAFAYMILDQMHWYPLALAVAEAILTMVLTLIFIQALPVFTLKRKHYQLKSEEIICLVILLASMMTGMVGWTVEGISVEHVMSRALILLFAFVGGAPLGASVGVITGLILSLASVDAIYQIGLLAFAGLLAGMLRDANRLAVALGMLIGSSILSLYVEEQSAILTSFLESLIAIGLFLAMPSSIIQLIAKYVPGTREHQKSQYDYAKRVRDVTADRVTQFSEVFRQLSQSFSSLSVSDHNEKQAEGKERLIDAVAQRSCATCWKRKKCWDEQTHMTYSWMSEMVSALEHESDDGQLTLREEWKRQCVKPTRVLKVMKKLFDFHQYDQAWRRQIQESRQLVAEQLFGVSEVMEDLAKEIKREGQELFLQEEQIREALEQMGLSIHCINIISLDEGNVEIEIMHQYNKGLDECRKIIAPLLSNILGENIAVKQESVSDENEGFYTVLFVSAKEYEIETGIAGAAKGGGLLSGDSFSTVELGNGKFAVALSDGMGNGERANVESQATLSILQKLLQSGMDEKLAVKSVNSILLLRSPDEMFATIDVALIDQYTAHTTFLKIGSTPSFIKRGQEVITVTASNLPVGILQEIEVDLIRVELKPGDILIMMTDGLFDAPGHAANKEKWMRRVIQELKAETPQDIADCLLETAVRFHHGEIHDDMTVVVAQVQRYQPEWTTFRWPGLTHIERPKTVS